MENLYGFNQKDLMGLTKFMSENPNMNKSKLFSLYAKKSGKNSGTIRNLYYVSAKMAKENKEFCDKYFFGKVPKIEKSKSFSKEETLEIVKAIMLKKREGYSVRSAVNEMANGDIKLALRYQNKYRSAINGLKEKREKEDNEKINQVKNNPFLYEKLKTEIDGLITRISLNFERENNELRDKLTYLINENSRLNQQLLKRNNSEII